MGNHVCFDHVQERHLLQVILGFSPCPAPRVDSRGVAIFYPVSTIESSRGLPCVVSGDESVTASAPDNPPSHHLLLPLLRRLCLPLRAADDVVPLCSREPAVDWMFEHDVVGTFVWGL